MLQKWVRPKKRRLCLPVEPDEFDGVCGTVSGWGKSEPHQPSDDYPKELQGNIEFRIIFKIGSQNPNSKLEFKTRIQNTNSKLEFKTQIQNSNLKLEFKTRTKNSNSKFEFKTRI